MTNNIEIHFQTQIVNKFRRLVELRRSRKAAHNHVRAESVELAGALFHLREHFPADVKKNSWADIESECPSYCLLADVANAAKHHTVTRNTPHGKPLVNSSDCIFEEILVVAYRDDEGIYFDGYVQVVVACSDGTRRNLGDAIFDVLNYWATRLESVSTKKFGPYSDLKLTSNISKSRSEVAYPEIELSQGLTGATIVQLRKFDASVGIAIPVNLSSPDPDLCKRMYRLELFDVAENGIRQPFGELKLSEKEADLIDAETDRAQMISTIIQTRKSEIVNQAKRAGRVDGQCIKLTVDLHRDTGFEFGGLVNIAPR